MSAMHALHKIFPLTPQQHIYNPLIEEVDVALGVVKGKVLLRLSVFRS